MNAMQNERERIDELDHAIIELLARRMAAVDRIGELKDRDGKAPVRDDRREDHIAAAWSEAAREHGLSEYFVGRILREILNYSRRAQESVLRRDETATGTPPLRLAIQGGPGSYSDLALDKLLADRTDVVERRRLGSFAAAVDALETAEVDFALLPIENTVAGSLNAVYQLIGGRNVEIVGEEELQVEHCLVAAGGVRVEDVRTIRSHPVALQQCGDFLSGLSACVAEGVQDTAFAAESVARERRVDLAAICSEDCARRLDLRVLKRDIADARVNVTRFVLLAREPQPVDRSRPGKTSLMLTVDNRRGSLARCLEAFAHRKINLSKLESRRRPEAPSEYLFYLDVDGYADDPELETALSEVRGYCRSFKVLGSYPRLGGTAPVRPVAGAARRPAPAPRPVVRVGAVRDTVHIGDVPIGGGAFALIAGPCAVESHAQIHAAAAMASRFGAVVLRGGAFKPRTSPSAFQGLGFPGVDLLAAAGAAYELPVLTEVLRGEDAARIAAGSDALQVGARNMQNFELLKTLGTLDRPVVLKRGLSASIDDLLAAAEYISAGGNRRIILCERGIRTFETATRSTLDVSAVPVLKSRTSLPVIVDPSHAAGRRDLVVPLALAAVAAGADGLLVEIHPNPDEALCDGPQALTELELGALTAGIEPMLTARAAAEGAGK